MCRAKVTSINVKFCNKIEQELGMHLLRELPKIEEIEVADLKEIIENFFENKKYTGCYPGKIRMLYSEIDSKPQVHLQKPAGVHTYQEIIVINIYDDAIKNHIQKNGGVDNVSSYIEKMV